MRTFGITTNQTALHQRGSRVERNVANKVARRKRRVLKGLERARQRRFIQEVDCKTVIGAKKMGYELPERCQVICHGGIGM